jgi:shikimate kinase/3-dehydroquinate synthase
LAKTVLIGFMGAGKSTAAGLSRQPALDVDEVVEAREGRPIAEIFATDGEQAFREIEERVTLELLDAAGPQLLAVGGGAILSARVREALRDCRVIWLFTDPEQAWERTIGGAGTRPLAEDPRAFRERHDAREPLYDEVADVIVPASRSDRLDDVLAALEGLSGSGVRTLWAASLSGDYPVYIGDGLLRTQRFWPATVLGRRVVVSDQNAGRLYGEALSPVHANIRVLAGEQSKTVAHAEIVWSELARAGVTRADLVVALGGGVIGDLAGFCAATYQRGIRYVQVPTTLLAQVDSAYGGKTGIDLPEAKNYVGAYHQPAAVIADSGTLATLPAEELAAGYAEVVKTALIAGGRLWERVCAGAAGDEPWVIATCAHTKLRLVERDERDSGLRQVLNLGHTAAHAIEAATGYARYRHGEAVGLGLLAELRLAGDEQLRGQVRELLAAHRLPVTLDAIDLDAVLAAAALDKKRVVPGAGLPFVRCERPGYVVSGSVAQPQELRAALGELCLA